MSTRHVTFEPLAPFGYDVIMCDPPWSFALRSEKGEAKSPQAHYLCMSDDEILALPVGTLARRDCALFLWRTAPKLELALACVRAWGFVYKTELVWRKVSEGGKVMMGPGYLARTCHESMIVATIGAPRFDHVPRSIFDGVRREHSRKPDEAYALVEGCMPRAFRADLFARERREGWDAWGYEAGHYNGEASTEPSVEPKANEPDLFT